MSMAVQTGGGYPRAASMEAGVPGRPLRSRERRIAEALKRHRPSLRLAMLFGSCAAGRERDGSDVDVALLDRAPLDMGAIVNIAGAVGDDLGRDVDVVDLYHVPVPIAGIALEGIRLFGSDDCYANLCSRALFEYESFGRLRAQLLDQRIDAWIRQ